MKRITVCLVLMFHFALFASDTPCPKRIGIAGRIWSWVKRHPKRVAAAVLLTPPAALVSYEQAVIPSNVQTSADYDPKKLDEGHLKITNLGDSLTTGFSAEGNQVKLLLDYRTKPRDRTWFFPGKHSDGATTLYDRLAEPRQMINWATPSARIGGPEGVYANSSARQWGLKIADLSDQVNLAVKDPVPSNLYTIVLEANMLDFLYFWKQDPTWDPNYDLVNDPEKKSERFRTYFAKKLAKNYVEEVSRLANYVKKHDYPERSAIVAFNIPSLAKYFATLDSLDASSQARIYSAFESFLPKHREATSELQDWFELYLALELGRKNYGMRVLAYISDDMKGIDLGDPTLVGPDGFHPSPLGKTKLSEMAQRGLKPALRHLKKDPW